MFSGLWDPLHFIAGENKDPCTGIFYPNKNCFPQIGNSLPTAMVIYLFLPAVRNTILKTTSPFPNIFSKRSISIAAIVL
jgi:hypothetical protein